VSGSAPRAPGDSVGPRRPSGVVVRPLNFTVSCPMKLDTKARLTAAVLLGLVGGVALRLYNLKNFHMSRDEFLAAQAARYDRLLAVHPSAFTAVVTAILMVGAAVGLYELLVFVVAKVLTRTGEGGSAEGS